jgi:hypothetical protein
MSVVWVIPVSHLEVVAGFEFWISHFCHDSTGGPRTAPGVRVGTARQGTGRNFRRGKGFSPRPPVW